MFDLFFQPATIPFSGSMRQPFQPIYFLRAIGGKHPLVIPNLSHFAIPKRLVTCLALRMYVEPVEIYSSSSRSWDEMSSVQFFPVIASVTTHTCYMPVMVGINLAITGKNWTLDISSQDRE